jgi:Rrf2 family protein
VKLQKSTRYALYAAMELARAAPDEVVTATSVAGLYGIPPSVVAKVFQRLVRRGIAVGTRGQGGGYRLARAADDVTMLDVIEALESRRRTVTTEDGEDAPFGARRLQQVFDEVDELERCTFASISLTTLARRSGLPRPPRTQPSPGRSSRAGR